MKVQNGIWAIIISFCLIFFPGKVFCQAVKVNWNDNSESDLDGYFLYCGTSQDFYDYVFNVGLKKPVYIKGLNSGDTYRFAVSAYDWWGNESKLSDDVQLSVPVEAQSDELINISLNPSEKIYKIGAYNPASAYVLEENLFKVRLELPEGAADTVVPLAIGVEDSSDRDFVELEIVPDGFSFNKPITISVSLPSSFGTNVVITAYDKFTWTWEKMYKLPVNNNSISFSTNKVSRFRIYPENYFPEPAADPSSSMLGGSGSGGGGSGGGGCFIGSTSEAVVHSWVLSSTLVLICSTCFFTRRRPR